jgi:hypothetical protein
MMNLNKKNSSYFKEISYTWFSTGTLEFVDGCRYLRNVGVNLQTKTQKLEVCHSSSSLFSFSFKGALLFPVVRQSYEVQVYRAHVLLGNTAVLHCVIPAFVKDYVTVTSWFRDDTIILPARDDAGKWIHLHCEKSETQKHLNLMEWRH